MRAGSLDREITIERASTTVTVAGTPVQTWAPLATLRAQLVESSTDEFMRGQGALSEATAVFRTRYLPDVSLADRITFDGAVFNLKQIKELGRRRGLELRAERTGA